MNDNKQEISALVEKVQQGDMDAFGKLYELVSPRSLFVAMEIVKNKQDAEDVLQDSFITALEKINTLEKGESFIGWFNRIVANKSKDFLKKKKPMLFGEEEKQVFELIPDEDKEFSPQENFNDNETRKIVLDAVNELSDEKRICVLLHYYNEMSISDIAQTVGANENTIKSRLFQARKDLSAKFKDLERKGLYSFSPIGLVLWAWQHTEESVAKGFIGSESSSAILASVTAKAGAGAASAAATTAAATSTAAGTAAAVGSGAASTAAATGTGIAAKIAALTVAQKIVAGVTIAGVVTASAAGTATVIKKVASEKAEETTTTAIYAVEDNVIASSEWFETNVVITDLSETETTAEVISVLATLTTKTTKKKTEEPSCTVAPTTKKSDETKAETQAPSQTKKKTKKSTTRRDYSLNQTKTSTTTVTTKPVTTKPTTTTKKQTTTEEPETTAKKVTSTKKVTTTKPTTTKATTTKPTTTEATEPTTKGTATIIVEVIDLDGYSVVGTVTGTIEEGETITKNFIFDLVKGKYSIDTATPIGDVGAIAEAGKTYTYQVDYMDI